jgi:Regulator of chromosome condensation (RCC1) repeat
MSAMDRVRFWPVVAAFVSLAVAPSACTAAAGDDVASEPDSGIDASTPPSPLQDAGPVDVAVSDVRPSDAGGQPKPLDVDCKGDPCYVAVSGNGGHHVCGLLGDGTVRCWGRDTMNPATTLDGGVVVPADGALGRGVPVSTLEGATPAPVVGLSDVTQISVGPNLGTCARTSDGSVFCWGRNELGQLGRPPSEARLTVPTRVDGLPPVDEVQLGYSTGCAIGSSDRALYCWGQKMNGLGVDAGSASAFPAQVVTEFRPPVKAVAIGTLMGLRNDTIIALLEGNVLSNVGGYPVGATSVFVPGPLEIAGVTRIATFAYAESDGLFRRWISTGGITSAPFIDVLYVPSLAPIIDVKISHGLLWPHGGALVATGRLFRWGPNTTGALGVHPDALLNTQYPVEVIQVKDQVVSFATTIQSTCASLVDGTVKCWGGNALGELGRGAIDFEPHPEAEVIR